VLKNTDQEGLSFFFSFFLFFFVKISSESALWLLTTQAAGQEQVLGHDGDTTSMNGAVVDIFEETSQVGLGGFLHSSNGRALEADISLQGDLLAC